MFSLAAGWDDLFTIEPGCKSTKVGSFKSGKCHITLVSMLKKASPNRWRNYEPYWVGKCHCTQGFHNVGKSISGRKKKKGNWAKTTIIAWGLHSCMVQKTSRKAFTILSKAWVLKFPTMPQPSVAGNPESKIGCCRRVGGMLYSFTPVNHSDTGQSWVSVSSRMQKRTNSSFLTLRQIKWTKYTCYVITKLCLH